MLAAQPAGASPGRPACGSLRAKLTYSNVLATLAIFIALGGVGYAATRLPKNSVGTKQIKRNAVIGAKVKNGSLGGADIDESSLGRVPDASHADSAGNADALDGQDSAAFAHGGSEGWHPADLENGTAGSNPPHTVCWWSNFGGGYADASYFRDGFGIVHFRGLIQAHGGSSLPCGFGGDGILFYLPAGYAPATSEAHPIISNNKPGRVNVDPGGQVGLESNFPSFSDAEAWVSLDGITFRCAPSGQNGCP
jgi:hypothetical protein